MKVFLTTAYDPISPQLHKANELAKLDRYKIHTLVDKPEDADLILFIEDQAYNDPFYRQLMNHPLVHQYRTKTLMYTDQDKPVYIIPGLYVSLHTHSAKLLKQRSTIYLLEKNEFIDEHRAINTEPNILYSFMGARTAFVREKLFAIDHPNGIVTDTTGFNVFGLHLLTPEVVKKRKQEYADLLENTKFVLCPRGIGTSSFRLYETMKVARVPVILSDNWVPPSGPKWDDFAIFVKERDVIHIQHILEELEPTWEEKGKLARKAWEEFFAPDVRFHYYIEQCKEILEASNGDIDFFQHKLTIQEIYMRIRKSNLRRVLSPIKSIFVKLYKKI